MGFARAAHGDAPSRSPLGRAGEWMLVEQDAPASRAWSLVGKEHWGEHYRGALLVFHHAGQGPLRLA